MKLNILKKLLDTIKSENKDYLEFLEKNDHR